MPWLQLWKQCNCIGNIGLSSNPRSSRYLTLQIEYPHVSEQCVLYRLTRNFTWNFKILKFSFGLLQSKMKRFYNGGKGHHLWHQKLKWNKMLWTDKQRDFNLNFSTPHCMLGFLRGFGFQVFSSSPYSR